MADAVRAPVYGTAHLLSCPTATNTALLTPTMASDAKTTLDRFVDVGPLLRLNCLLSWTPRRSDVTRRTPLTASAALPGQLCAEKARTERWTASRSVYLHYRRAQRAHSRAAGYVYHAAVRGLTGWLVCRCAFVLCIHTAQSKGFYCALPSDPSRTHLECKPQRIPQP
jgi:hypothetical protein